DGAEVAEKNHWRTTTAALHNLGHGPAGRSARPSARPRGGPRADPPDPRARVALDPAAADPAPGGDRHRQEPGGRPPPSRRPAERRPLRGRELRGDPGGAAGGRTVRVRARRL